MKIAQLCPYDIHRPGGVQMHIRDLSEALRERGHAVTIIAPRVGPSVPDTESLIHLGAARKIGFGGTAFEISIAMGADHRRLAALMRQDRFDVVHFHTIWTPMLPLQAFRLSGAANVATFHDTPPDTWGGALTRLVYRGFSRWLLPRLDGVIAVSEAPAGHLRPTGDQRLALLPPCTDLRRFMSGAAPFDRYRDGRVNILFLGRLEPRKGAAILVEAYRRLCAEDLPVRLLIAGDGDLAPMLRGAVAKHGVPRVEFIGRFPDADAPRWYATCDIYCAPSMYGESFGIVLTEAMASGRPVVAAANHGYRTVLRGEAAAFLAPPGDVDATYRLLRQLVLDAPMRERLGDWGLREAPRYDCRVLAPQFEAIYRRAMATARRAT